MELLTPYDHGDLEVWIEQSPEPRCWRFDEKGRGEWFLLNDAEPHWTNDGHHISEFLFSGSH